MTALDREITRMSSATVREAGRSRRIVVTLYPSGVLGLRPERTRREEYLSLTSAYEHAVKARVARERSEKRAAKAAKRRIK